MQYEITEKLREFLSRTGNLLIHLLNRCNLECKHCYLRASPSGDMILSQETVKNVLDEAHHLNLHAVQFSGGEPLLHPDIENILVYTKDKRFNTYLSTNATLIDDAFAHLLSQSRITVIASIDGPPSYHDTFRGKNGAFEEAQTGLAYLAKHSVNFKIVMTVSRENYQYIDWCADLAYRIKANAFQIQPLEKIGRGDQIGPFHLSDDQMNTLFIHLSDLAVKYGKLGLKISMTYQSRDYMLAHPCKAFVCNGKKCHRGVEQELKKIIVRENGVILPELVDINPLFAIGNLYEKSLTDNISHFLENDYVHFDNFCRSIYHEIVPNYPSALIPWNEILSERSWSWVHDKNFNVKN